MAKLSIRNIGPIRSADLRTSDLTVFIGPNNAGKSVAATVLHAAFSAAPTPVPYSYRVRTVGGRTIAVRLGTVTEYLGRHDPEEIEAALLGLMEAESIESAIDDLPVSDIIDSYLTDTLNAFGEALVESLVSGFKSELDDLVNVYEGRRMPARIDVHHQSPAWSLRITLGRPRPRVHVEALPPREDVVRLLDEVQQRLERRQRSRTVRSSRSITGEVFGMLSRPLTQEFAPSSYYLPAARSGILQSHRQLAAALVRSSVRVGLEPMQVPQMSGLVADFISNLIEINELEEGDFQEIADWLEETLIQGHVDVHLAGGYPELSYSTPNVDLPIHRTSSMVSELAPVVLYLRHVLAQGDLLIVEEPEAHLHPASQLRMADGLARCVRAGLKVALTTHSDVLFQALNNRIRASRTQQERLFPDGDEPGFEKVENSVDVAAYVFETRASGTTVVELEQDADLGFSDAEFARVSEALYRETVAVDYAVSDTEE